MTFDALIGMFAKYGLFDLTSAIQLSGDDRNTVRVQLHRWSKEGKLIALRRGMYAFAQRYGQQELNPAELANLMYVPSYISTFWALGYYGLIPEKVVTYTSVTTRVPRTFSNKLGTFKYQNIKASAFFGFVSASIGERKVLLAEPEKALLDMWHLGLGQWDENRMKEMRFQNFEVINIDKLRAYSSKFVSPRLTRAVLTWESLARMETEGTVEL